MTRKAIIRPAAQREIDQQASYLAEHAGDAVAYRFLAAVDETCGLLLNAPEIGSPWMSDHPRLQGIRKFRVAGFPHYTLFYRCDGEHVEVLHLYHAKQDIAARLNDEADAGEDGP